MKISPTVRNIGVSFFWLMLTAGFVFLILKYGISAAVKIAEYLQRNNAGSEGGLTDNFVAKPKLFPVIEATNSADLLVSGFGPANKEIILTINDAEIKSLSTDSEGKFEGMVTLSLGKNTFYAVTKDFQGIVSSPSETFTVFYSDSPPLLEITEPLPDSTVRNNPNITIKGKAEETSKVYVNDHLVSVDSQGFFSFPAKLQKGENIFKVICTDPAKNTIEKEIKLSFRP